MDRRDGYAHPRHTDETRVSRRALFGLRMGARARQDIDYETATARVRADAETGHAWPLIEQLGPVADVLAEVTEVRADERVLDAGAGDGNVARACRALGAHVDACDLAVTAVARGRERCDDGVTWHHADLQALPFENAQFDVVMSAFGIAHAPRPARAIEEFLRVCRPGGRIAIAAWVPRGLPGRLVEFVEQVRPLPDGIRSADIWGRDVLVRERLAPVLDELEMRTRTVRIAGLDADTLFAALTPGTFTDAQRAELRPAFDQLLASASTEPDRVELDARFLVVSGRRPL